MEVRSRERLREHLSRLVGEEANRARHLETPRERGQLAVPRAEARDHDAEPLEVAEEGRGADEAVEVLGVADVPRVHDDECVRQPVLAGPTRCPAAAA